MVALHHKWHHAISQITGAISLQRGSPDIQTIIEWATVLLQVAKAMRQEAERKVKEKEEKK
jgi:hypothetical protein